MRRILTAFALLACASSAQAMTYAEAGWFIENGLPLNVLYELAMIDCGGKGDLTACQIAEAIAQEHPEAVPAPRPVLRGHDPLPAILGQQAERRACLDARRMLADPYTNGGAPFAVLMPPGCR